MGATRGAGSFSMWRGVICRGGACAALTEKRHDLCPAGLFGGHKHTRKHTLCVEFADSRARRHTVGSHTEGVLQQQARRRRVALHGGQKQWDLSAWRVVIKGAATVPLSPCGHRAAASWRGHPLR